MARVCVNDSCDFSITPDGVLNLNDRVGSQQILRFTTPGTFSFNPASFPCLRSIRVIAVGGGGGGAGANAAAGEAIARAGGSAGGVSESVFNRDQLTGPLAVVVGDGGAAGSGNNPGADGNPSSFGGGLVTAPGGRGSTDQMPSGTGPYAVNGTTGPTSGTGQITMGGGAGGGAIRVAGNVALAGAGGDTGLYGTGGGQRATEGGAYGARGVGGGGGGAVSYGSNQDGGPGGNGGVFIYLYF